MVNKKVIFLGSPNAKYHPMEGVAIRLTELLPDSKVLVTSELGILDPKELMECSVLVMYTEFDLPLFTDHETASVISYTANGGSLLVLHNGISAAARNEIRDLIGAVFTGHPPYDTLPRISYHIEAPEHPIFAGVSDFILSDEAYQFAMNPDTDKELLLSYDFEGERVPAGWYRPYGEGRMVYLCCGHNKEGFYDSQFGKILQNTIAWLN